MRKPTRKKGRAAGVTRGRPSSGAAATRGVGAPPSRPGASPAGTAQTATPNREQDILHFIASSLEERGYPPTLREIGEAFGIASTNGVRYYLDRLEQAGSIRRDRWTSRGIELQAIERVGEGRGRWDRADDHDGIVIPLIGRVAAGTPILAEEHVEDTLVVDGSFARGGKHFALRVRGDSMKDAGILDGDVVIVRHEAPVQSGDIAVVVMGEEATVKRYFPRRDRILLIPENEKYEPIELTPEDPDVRVAGKVVGVFRRLG